MTLVPNKFPKNTPTARRLAIVGEAPGTDEEETGEPFVGFSGRLLRFVLGSVNHAAEQCLLANVCQQRPYNSDIENFAFEGPEIQAGLAQLNTDLAVFKPNCILALGRTAFRALNPDRCYTNEKGTFVVPLSDWRGSLFQSTQGYKAVGTYHPAYILRAYNDIGLFRFDVARAVNQSSATTLTRRQRQYTLRPTLEQVLQYCARIVRDKRTVSLDLEGICNHIGITCFSFFTSPDEGMCFPVYINGQHYWSHDEEVTFWQAIASVLSNESIPKIAQNALYELFVFLWKHKIVLVNVTEDTMLKHHELFPEFEKSLELQASVYTLEPYWKDQRTSNDPDTQLTYNCTDSAVTFECSLAQDALLRQYPKSADHYRFNVQLLPAFNYIGLRGVKLDLDLVHRKMTTVQAEIDTLQGNVEALLGRKFNAKSWPDKQWLLYEYFGYEPYARKGKSTDEETLHRYFQKFREPLLKLVIQLVGKRTRRSDLGKLLWTDADGRIRASYDLCAVTGRLKCRESISMVPTFSKAKHILRWEHAGTNHQNQAKDVRDCFIADDGCFMFQCDLTGADAQTVAADLAALGHPTMLEDLRHGIKPAKVLLAMLEEYEAGRDAAAFNRLPREEIKRRTDAIKVPKGVLPDGRPGDWKYVCMKRVQHGTNYDAQSDTISATIFKDSDGLIDLTPATTAIYQSLYRLRYNTQARTEWVRAELARTGIIQTATGLRRKFYAIRGPRMLDAATVREALAMEPQAVTTYVCNRGLHRLWHDPQNRTTRGALFVEPLIQIHDALAGQFKEKHLDWARARINEWMTNPITIHGIDVTIPFEGKYGKNWLDLDNDL